MTNSDYIGWWVVMFELTALFWIVFYFVITFIVGVV